MTTQTCTNQNPMTAIHLFKRKKANLKYPDLWIHDCVSIKIVKDLKIYTCKNCELKWTDKYIIKFPLEKCDRYYREGFFYDIIYSENEKDFLFPVWDKSGTYAIFGKCSLTDIQCMFMDIKDRNIPEFMKHVLKTFNLD